MRLKEHTVRKQYLEFNTRRNAPGIDGAPPTTQMYKFIAFRNDRTELLIAEPPTNPDFLGDDWEVSVRDTDLDEVARLGPAQEFADTYGNTFTRDGSRNLIFTATCGSQYRLTWSEFMKVYEAGKTLEPIR